MARASQREDYVVKPGDTLTDILYARGIGQGEGPQERIYGKRNWLKINQSANSHIKDWRALEVGTQLTLQLPDGAGARATAQAALPSAPNRQLASEAAAATPAAETTRPRRPRPIRLPAAPENGVFLFRRRWWADWQILTGWNRTTTPTPNCRSRGPAWASI